MHDNCIRKFTNCYLLRDKEIIKDDLWVRRGKIINPEPLFFEEKIGPTEVIDCGGALIAPGLIDLQINGGFGVDFSKDMKDEKSVQQCIRKVARKLLAHGKLSLYLIKAVIFVSEASAFNHNYNYFRCHLVLPNISYFPT